MPPLRKRMFGDPFVVLDSELWTLAYEATSVRGMFTPSTPFADLAIEIPFSEASVRSAGSWIEVHATDTRGLPALVLGGAFGDPDWRAILAVDAGSAARLVARSDALFFCYDEPVFFSVVNRTGTHLPNGSKLIVYPWDVEG